jgi:3-(3-hydroxy-phenyl)propionate hydroxylase
MGQGMCAGIRDASNLAWKISSCLKNKHNEKLLDTYQTERFSNVKEYIETTMRMGKFMNEIGSSKVSNTVSLRSDGTLSMETIKPKLGKGLGKISNKNRGKIFPQLKMKNGKILDHKFSGYPILLLSSQLNKKKLISQIPSFNENEIVGLSKLLKNYKAIAIMVRPDRFVLETCNKLSDFSNFVKQKMKEVNIT